MKMGSIVGLRDGAVGPATWGETRKQKKAPRGRLYTEVAAVMSHEVNCFQSCHFLLTYPGIFNEA